MHTDHTQRFTMHTEHTAASDMRAHVYATADHAMECPILLLVLFSCPRPCLFAPLGRRMSTSGAPVALRFMARRLAICPHQSRLVFCQGDTSSEVTHGAKVIVKTARTDRSHATTPSAALSSTYSAVRGEACEPLACYGWWTPHHVWLDEESRQLDREFCGGAQARCLCFSRSGCIALVCDLGELGRTIVHPIV